MRLDRELLGCPLLTGVDQAAVAIVKISVEAGSQTDRSTPGHLKIVPTLLNIGNAPRRAAFLLSTP